MKLYLDNCCYNRPYDTQTEFKVSMETRAKLHIQDEIRNGKYELVGSYMLEYENDKNPDIMRRTSIKSFQEEFCTEFVSRQNEGPLQGKINEIMEYNIQFKDATHAACAIFSGCDYLLTTDIKFQRRYKGKEIKIINPIDFIQLEEVEAKKEDEHE